MAEALLFAAFASGEPDRYTQIMQASLSQIGVQVDAARLRLFRRGLPAQELAIGSDVSALLGTK